MAEQKLPWIPSPQSSRTERTTSHHDDSRRRTPLYSDILTSPRMTPTFTQKVSLHAVKRPADRVGGKNELNDRSTIQSHKSPPQTSLASPRLGHEPLTDISRNHEGGDFNERPPISTTISSPDVHEVCHATVNLT